MKLHRLLESPNTQQFINQEVAQWVENVTKECSSFIKHSTNPLYRGIVPTVGTYGFSPYPVDRPPIDPNEVLPEARVIFNEMMYQMYGDKVGEGLRTKTAFTSSAKSVAIDYNSFVYYVFPTDDSKAVIYRGYTAFEVMRAIDAALRLDGKDQTIINSMIGRFGSNFSFSETNRLSVPDVKEEVMLFGGSGYYYISVDDINDVLERTQYGTLQDYGDLRDYLLKYIQ